jgi:hypothetical protein
MGCISSVTTGAEVDNISRVLEGVPVEALEMSG